MMGVRMRKLAIIGALVTFSAWAQSGTDEGSRPKAGPGREIGGGAATIGKGAAKGAGHAGEGIAKGAGDLVTLHPVDAGAAVVRGAGSAGKDLGVGTVKGSAKMVHGAGRAIKHLF